MHRRGEPAFAVQGNETTVFRKAEDCLIRREHEAV